MDSFSSWYYKEAVVKATKIWQSVIILTFDTFSIPLLVKTLIAPWRRDVVRPAEPSLGLIFHAIAFNLVSRLIGLIIRLGTIMTGLVVTLMVTILGGAILVMIATLPFTFFIGVLIALIFLTNPVLVTVGAILIGSSAIIWSVTFVWWRGQARYNPPLPQPLESLVSDLARNRSIDIGPYLEGHLQSEIKVSQSLSELFKKLLGNQAVCFILAHAVVPEESLINLRFSADLNLKNLIAQAAQIATHIGATRITAAAVFLALIRQAPTAQTILQRCQINIDQLTEIAWWYHHLDHLSHQPSPLLDPAKLKTTGGIGRDWAAGYTPTLEKFASELTHQLPPTFGDHYLSHTETVDQIERVLARSGRHNVLVIGESGVGKRTVVLALVWRMHFGKTLRPLRHKRVLELDVSAVLAGASIAGELEARLVSILNNAVSAGNVVLFVDRLERLFGAEAGQAGAINAGEILIPYLESSALQLVGTTTFADYHRFFERQPAVVTQFERVEAREPKPDQVLKILEEVAPIFETRYGILVSFPALKEIITIAERYLTNRKFPEKAIDLLDEAAVHLVSSSPERVLLPQHIDEVVSQKINVPIGQVDTEEKDKLLRLEDGLHERVVNQWEAIESIAQALRRARTGVGRQDRPIGTFLFLGPTGVGKTETAKSLAAIYFGSEKTMIRLDMNEFQDVASINRLIGGAGFETGGFLTNSVKERPFSVLLLDEIEKAHPNVLNLFLQLLDEGRLQDASGEVVNFTNTIIIGTSNAGAEFIRQGIKQAMVVSSAIEQSPQEISNLKYQISNKIQNDQNPNQSDFKEQLLEYLQQHNIFRPEFLNRFDAIVTFRPLDKAELIKVVDLHIKRINKNLADKEMSIVVTPQAAAKLAEIGFDPQFGARALARAIQQKVENLIADKILRNQLQPGGVLEISEEMIK